MIEVPSPADRIVMVGDFKGFTPEELFDHWIKPEFLEYWWPARAQTDPALGGRYEFSWPDMGWYLRGTYTEFEPGKRLSFTWSWNHDEPGLEPLLVELYFVEIAEGTRLAIYHGPFSLEDQAARQGVVEGWIHFGMKLAGLRRQVLEDEEGV